MTNLEYILNMKNIRKIDLSKELKIERTNLTEWGSGRRKIPSKYMEYFSKKLNVPSSLIIGNLDLDSKNKIDKYIFNRRWLSERYWKNF